MSENPDFRDDVHGTMVATAGDLRFVVRIVDNHGTPKKVRILQRYEWSYTLAAFGWFDVPLHEGEGQHGD